MAIGGHHHAAASERLFDPAVQPLFGSRQFDVVQGNGRSDRVGAGQRSGDEVVVDERRAAARQPPPGHRQHSLVLVDADHSGFLAKANDSPGQGPGANAEIHDGVDWAARGRRERGSRRVEHLFVVWNERPYPRVVLAEVDLEMSGDRHAEAC